MQTIRPLRGHSQVILLDFLAPRLLASPRPRWFTQEVRLPHQINSSRYSTVSTGARPPTDKLSFFDNDRDTDNDLSLYASEIRRCAKKADVLGVWTAHQHLRNKHPRLVLGPEHNGATSLMLVKLFADMGVSSDGRTEEEMHATEELAFACASTGYTEGLRQMMIWLLAKGEANKVIQTFERFERTVLDLDKSGLERATADSDATAVEDDDNPSDSRMENPDIGRLDAANIIAITIAAHASRNTFHDALQLVLRRRSHRTTQDNIRELERELLAYGVSKSEKLISKTAQYIEATGMARLVQQPEVLKAHIRNLTRESEKNPTARLEKVMRLILDGFKGKLPWAAKNESERSTKRPVVVSEKVWAHLIHAFITTRMESFAESLWADLLRLGIVPGTVIWNALLEGYRDTRQPYKLMNSWEAMEREGVARDAASYGAILGCLYQERSSYHQAMKLFEDFKRTEPSDEDTLFVYNTVLNGLLSRKNVQGADALLQEMRRNGPRPDVVTYNIQIAYHAKKVDMRSIAAVVQQLTTAGVAPDVFTFTTILAAMLKARVPNGPARLLAIMQDMGVKQNVATYSAIIDSQVRTGTRQGIRTAWELLQQIERMKDIKPNIVTYTSFLAGVHRSRELGKEQITSISSDVVGRMRRRGIRLKLGTYHILLKACLENPNPEGIEFFMDYYNMMLRESIQFRHDTWYVILNGLIRRDEWALASEMKDRMIKTDFQPMWGVLEMVKVIRQWEADNGRMGY